MNWWDRMKAAFVKAGLSEEDLAELGEPDVVANAAEGKSADVLALEAQLAKRDSELVDLRTAIAGIVANARTEKVTALVDARVAAGKIAPAERGGVIAIAMELPESSKVKTFAADGTASEIGAVEAFLGTYDARKPLVSTQSRGQVWTGSEDPNAEPEALDDAALTAIAALA